MFECTFCHEPTARRGLCPECAEIRHGAAALARQRIAEIRVECKVELPQHVEPVAPPPPTRPVERLTLPPLPKPPERLARAPQPVQAAADMAVPVQAAVAPLAPCYIAERRRVELLRVLSGGWMSRQAIEVAMGVGRYASFAALQSAEAVGLVRKVSSGRRTEWGLATAADPTWAAALVPVPDRLAALRAWMPRHRWWARSEAQVAIGCNEEEVRHALKMLRRSGEIVVHGRAHLSLWGVPGLCAPTVPLIQRILGVLRLKSPMRLEDLAKSLSVDRRKIQNASQCSLGDERIAKGARGWSYRAKEGE